MADDAPQTRDVPAGSPESNPGEDAIAHRIDEIARAIVRPTVTILFAAAFIFFTFLGYVSGEVFSSVAGMIFAFWFSSRNQEKSDLNVSKVLQSTPVHPDVNPQDPRTRAASDDPRIPALEAQLAALQRELEQVRFPAP